jgi:glyoxylase-like metal-dependent hydrolase (beta-lactamase superfamily II)
MTIVHTYAAGEQGLFVNSYLLETREGVILVDANLLTDDALALAARLRALHKPLLAAFVTHAHPDHFNGLPYLVPDGVPVYASKQLDDIMRRFLPGAPLTWMIGLGADAVAKELATV